MSTLNVLCIGDIIGRPGRNIISAYLNEIKKEHNINFSIANIENSARGFGITDKVYKELALSGINAFTSGNHIYAKKDFVKKFDEYPLLIRPLNFPPGNPGEGVRYFQYNDKKIAVINLIGRIFMDPLDCPFQTMERKIEEVKKTTPIIFIDLHAEATSEKEAMGWYLAGKVSCLFGTHTHVQTADEAILDDFTAYITDIGMVGPKKSIIGVDKDMVIKRFFDFMPVKFEPAKSDIAIFNAIKVTVDTSSGKAVSIERIRKEFDSI